MLHTHFRLIVASTRTNGRSLVTCNHKSVTILQTSTSTDPLKIYIRTAALVHIRGFHCVLVTPQACSLAHSPAIYAHVDPRDAALPFFYM